MLKNEAEEYHCNLVKKFSVGYDDERDDGGGGDEKV